MTSSLQCDVTGLERRVRFKGTARRPRGRLESWIDSYLSVTGVVMVAKLMQTCIMEWDEEEEEIVLSLTAAKKMGRGERNDPL